MNRFELAEVCENGELTVDMAAVESTAAKGLPLLPIARGQKFPPLIAGWADGAASSDLNRIQQWHREFPGCNFAIYTGDYIGVDVDSGPGKAGRETLDALAAEGKTLPPTLTHESVTTGDHYIYKAPYPVAGGNSKLGRHIDIKAHRGYLLAPGSVVGGKRYTIKHNLPSVPAPSWLVEACGPASHKAAKPAIDEDKAAERAKAFLESMPVATPGSRNDCAFKTAAKLKDEGVGEVLCRYLMLDHWRCEPMLDHDELRTAIANAYKHGRNSFGIHSPEVAFSPETYSMDAAPDWVRRINETWFFLSSGDGVIGRFAEDPILKRCFLKTISRQGFRNQFENAVPLLIDGKHRNPYEAWLRHPRRRQYLEGVTFAPQGDVSEGWLNLWTGFSVKPSPGDCSKFKAHVRDVIASGDQRHFEYIWSWLARMVQRPWEVGGVALALRGGKGAGKTTFYEPLKRIMGAHGVSLSSASELTGRFNAAVEGAVLLVLNEGFWAGDKQGEATLKNLITDETHRIERKYKDAYEIKNVAHVMILGNSDWLVPASKDERRFAVFDVSPARTNDRKYFGAIREELGNGGYEALLHDLLSHDLGEFDVFDYPQTKALADQKSLSRKGPEAWLAEALHEGVIRDDHGFDHWWTDTGLSIELRKAHCSYAAFSKANREHRPDTASQFGQFLRKILGPAYRKKRLGTGANRENTAIFGPLEDCRREFEKSAKTGPIDWDQDHDDIFT